MQTIDTIMKILDTMAIWRPRFVKVFPLITFSSKRRYSDLSERQLYFNCLGCYPTTSIAQPEVCVCCEHPVLRNLPPEAILLRKNIPITCPNDCVSNNYYLRSRLDELLNRRNLKRVTYFNLPISQQTKFRLMGTGGKARSGREVYNSPRSSAAVNNE
jgi:hypothetical protein